MSKFRKHITEFLENNKAYPIVFAIAAGLYSFIYVYHSNFMLVNSAFQFVVIFAAYILFPIIVYTLSWELIKRVKILGIFKNSALPILNAAFFTAYFVGRIYGFHERKIVLAYVIGVSLLAIILRKQYKKIVVIQFIMAFIAFVCLLPTLYRAAFDSGAWREAPENITETQFKTFPNVYIIQPDGYVNFRELAKSPYNFDNQEFENYLKNSGFKLYDTFRSNYTSTVLSNSSMFAMKHHYKGEQLFGAREVIAGDNPVVKTFKNNNYQTFLLMENPYLLLNRPTILYDSCNFSMEEVPWFGFGAFTMQKDLIHPLEKIIQRTQGKRAFYFVEKIAPGHISTFKNQALGIEQERENYLKNLAQANQWLKEILSVIIKNDPNSLIVIAADHGGYVGLNYTKELFEKQIDEALIYSSFSAALAIKWPDNSIPIYDEKLKTPVNLFRILFAYLGADASLLENLEDDKSFSIIKKNAPSGVYEYIDNDGTVVFRKVEN